MRRFAISLLLAAAFVITVPAAAAAAAPADAADRAANGSAVVAVRSSTDDFSFDSMHADFELGIDGDGRSTLRTTEALVARFPDVDQNHGIRRAIPRHYRGHLTDVEVMGVTDENGSPRGFETETSEDGDFLLVTIADADYVHGVQSYVITYTQRDVILFANDSENEEFYWDVNGTGWAQPFGEVTASLRIDPALVPKLNGDTACYEGVLGNTTSCTAMASAADGDAWLVTARATDLAPFENLTVAIGFRPGTFVPRDDSFFSSGWSIAGLGAAIAAFLTAIGAWIARMTVWRDHPGRGMVIPEYLPPKGVNLLEAADACGRKAKAMPAQFLSFAVRHKVRVVERKKHAYALEAVTSEGLDPTESEIFGALFSLSGTRDLSKPDTILSGRLRSVGSAASEGMLGNGYRVKRGGGLRGLLVVVGAIAAGASLLFGIIALDNEVGSGWPVLAFIAAVLFAVLTFGLASRIRPLTEKGAELRDYLAGMKLYIGLAEQERLRVLQSPEGALRSSLRPDPDEVVPADAAAGGSPGPQVLKLYERMLPFAVLFGQEKDWAAVLSDYYEREGTAPDWYAGSGPFNAAVFSSGIGSFSSSSSSSWSSSSSSSSSGGSSGGGSSGGGGGGGGGGV
ncbi:DUF2207 family protein [Luethyella okanaganae]|uniref:DUF2207 family protein n=1 Tax=Luethyella okanaganae TaxID=69372 RepID=A0ABW1VHC6_9MICO